MSPYLGRQYCCLPDSVWHQRAAGCLLRRLSTEFWFFYSKERPCNRFPDSQREVFLLAVLFSFANCWTCCSLPGQLMSKPLCLTLCKVEGRLKVQEPGAIAMSQSVGKRGSASSWKPKKSWFYSPCRLLSHSDVLTSDCLLESCQNFPLRLSQTPWDLRLQGGYFSKPLKWV